MAPLSMPSFLSSQSTAVLLASLCASAFLLAAPARADDGAIPLRVVVADNDTTMCPNANAFFAEVRAIEPRAHSSESTSAPLVEIAFCKRPNGGFHGALRFDDHNSGRLTRTAEGNDCADVARALAIVAALHASEAASVKPPVATSLEPVVSITPDAGDERAPPEKAQGTPRVSAHEVFAGGGFRSGVLTGLSPFGNVGYALHGKRTSRAPLTVRLGLEFGQDASELTIARLIAGSFDVCPFGFGSFDKLSLSTCMRGELGAKMVGASYRGTTQEAPWGAFGALATLSARVVRGLTVELDVAALAPLVRTRFIVGSSDFGRGELGRVESDASIVVVTAGLGIGWSFFSDFGARR